jgi:hypothetical protein
VIKSTAEVPTNEMQQENAMKTTISLTALVLGSASNALAASGAENDGTGLFFWIFLGFGAMVIAFQFFPGLLMFFGMLKGLFPSAAREADSLNETKKG